MIIGHVTLCKSTTLFKTFLHVFVHLFLPSFILGISPKDLICARDTNVTRDPKVNQNLDI